MLVAAATRCAGQMIEPAFNGGNLGENFVRKSFKSWVAPSFRSG